MILARRIGAGLLICVGLYFMCSFATSLAQGPVPKKDDQKAPYARPKWNDRQIAFEMRAKPWGTVFEWFSDQTGMPFSSQYAPPTGTLTFINPKIDGKPREYTLAQVFDIINEILQTQHKYTLIRGENTLTMFPADEQIPARMIRQVAPNELEECGTTEIVRIIVKIEGANADEAAPEVKKVLGDFGHVVVLASSNSLILQADTTALKQAYAICKSYKEDEPAQTFVHTCLYVRASHAVQLLNKFVGNTPQIVEMPVRQPGGGDRPMSGGNQPPQPQPNRLRNKPLTITSDDLRNQVLINGPPDKIGHAKTALLKIDVPGEDNKKFVHGIAGLQYHDVRGGNAELVAKVLIDRYKDVPSVQVVPAGGTRLLVWADPQTHLEIANTVNRAAPLRLETVEIQLALLDAKVFAESLKLMFPDSQKSAPYIEADGDRNSIRLRGTPELIKEVASVIKVLDENVANASGAMRVVNLEKGSGATMAEALMMLLPRIRDNPIKIQLPGTLDLAPPKPAPTPNKSSYFTPPAQKTDPTLERVRLQVQDHNISSDTAQGKGQPSEPPLFDPKPEAKAPAKIDPRKTPLTITAFGNKVILSSDDPDALNMAQSIIRLLANTEAGPGDFQVIRLKNANAVEVAKILDEAFNGKGQGGGGRGGPPPGGGGGGGFNPLSLVTGALGIGGGQGGGRVESVRVVADPATNSLLVRAKPLDLLTIRGLLTNHIDSDFVDSNAVVKTFIVGPLKNASAVEIGDIITSVFRDQMDPRQSGSGSTGGGFGGGFGGFGGGPRTTDSSGADRRVALSLAVDAKNNSIVLHTNTTLYGEIKRLIDDLEKNSIDSKQVVKVISIKDIDPATLALAIEAIQGRTGTRRLGDSGIGTGGLRIGGGGGFQGGSGFFPSGGFSGSSFPGSSFPGSGGGTPIFMPFPSTGGPGGGPSGGGPGIRTPGGGGGSFTPGGGGGGTKGRPPGRSQSRGPDFFEQRVMDDPRVSLLYDPSENQEAPPVRPLDGFVRPAFINASAASRPHFTLAAAQPIPPKEIGLDSEPKGSDSVIAPRLPVQIEVLPGDVMIIKAQNPADLALVLNIIDIIRRQTAPANIEIEMVPVKNADPTSIVNTLSGLFGRVQMTPNATTLSAGGARPPTPAQPPTATPGQPTPILTPTQATPALQPNNIVMIPLPRLSSILVAASKARMPDVKREIGKLDQKPVASAKAVFIPLKHQPAGRAATLITNFYADRFTPESRGTNQIRISFDENSNSVVVQAAPADLDEIRGLIKYIDSTEPASANEFRIVRLNTANAQDLAQLLMQSISDGVLTPASVAPAIAAAGQAVAGQAAAPGGFQQTIQGSLQALLPAGQRATANMVSRLKFKGSDGKPFESGFLENMRINADQRTNSLIISAPVKTMELILAIISDLDTVPSARSEINIFHLKKADATKLALSLQQLFLGQTGLTGTGGGAGGVGGIGGAGGVGGQVGRAQPLQLTVQNFTPEGAVIIDLRMTVDERTNSLIVAGSKNDLLVVEAIIMKLEDAKGDQRRSQAVRLRNAQAVDVANAVTDFFNKTYTVYLKQPNGEATPWRELQREVVVVAEPISNSLLINATPEYFNDVLQMVANLDTTPMQVMIQVVIAEVQLKGSEEFGIEFGLQTPIFFQRGVTATDANGNITAASPGFNFNSTNPSLNGSLPNTNFQNFSLVGFQGLSNLGVGRASAINPVGGFTFSVANDTVTVLMRALRVQNRVNVLSRPQLMTLDNQTALMTIGQDVPTQGSTTFVGATGNFPQTTIQRFDTGVNMQVTPRITPDGRVMMRVIPEVLSVAGLVPLGNGTSATAFNKQHLETTVTALDGETVILGGMISSRDEKNENKVPWLGDLPGVGAMFRFRTEQKERRELLLIMTPHIVRNRHDAERIMSEESRRIDWVVKDVMRIHGPQNCAPLAPHSIGPADAAPHPYRTMPNVPTAVDVQRIPIATPHAVPRLEPQAERDTLKAKVARAMQAYRSAEAAKTQVPALNQPAATPFASEQPVVVSPAAAPPFAANRRPMNSPALPSAPVMIPPEATVPTIAPPATSAPLILNLAPQTVPPTQGRETQPWIGPR